MCVPCMISVLSQSLSFGFLSVLQIHILIQFLDTLRGIGIAASILISSLGIGSGNDQTKVQAQEQPQNTVAVLPESSPTSTSFCKPVLPLKIRFVWNVTVFNPR